jgi:hypothetical protein
MIFYLFFAGFAIAKQLMLSVHSSALSITNGIKKTRRPVYASVSSQTVGRCMALNVSFWFTTCFFLQRVQQRAVGRFG